MNIKATRRRMISCFAQIINDYVQGYKIPELVKHEKIKARKLSYASLEIRWQTQYKKKTTF